MSESISMSITGHATPQIFRRYAIRDTEEQRDALRRIRGEEPKKDSNVVALRPGEDR